MENAAREALSALRSVAAARGMPLRGARVLLLMGSGSNGGDAACLARHLLDEGARPLVLFARAPGRMRGAAGRFARLARGLGVPFRPLPASGDLSRILSAFVPDIIADGLLGTGFHGELRTRELNLVRNVNALRRAALVFALDVSFRPGRPERPAPAGGRARACHRDLSGRQARPDRPRSAGVHGGIFWCGP